MRNAVSCVILHVRKHAPTPLDVGGGGDDALPNPGRGTTRWKGGIGRIWGIEVVMTLSARFQGPALGGYGLAWNASVVRVDQPTRCQPMVWARKLGPTDKFRWGRFLRV